jgi:hypothetical protein
MFLTGGYTDRSRIPVGLNTMKMHYRLLCTSLAGCLIITNLSAQVAIGEWRDHLTYRNAIAITEGNGLAYLATESAVFSHDPFSGELNRINTVNALSDVGISTIAWNDSLNALLVGYSNGNLDMIRGDRTTNLNDIEQSTLIGDKSIYNIESQGAIAYLSCGFGIVAMDLGAQEVRETWFIGPGGSQLLVQDIAFFNDSIYAATNAGLYVASQNEPNLSAFTSWRKNQSIGNIPNGPFNAVEVFNNHLFVNYSSAIDDSDTLYHTSDQVVWAKLNPLFGNANLKLQTENGYMTVTHRFSADMVAPDLTVLNTVFGYDSDAAFPRDALRSIDGRFLVADSRFGMIRSNGGTDAERIYPNGPATIDTRRIVAKGGALYVATGGVEGNWTNQFDKHGVFHYQNGEWQVTSLETEPLMVGPNPYGGAVVDIMAVTIDPDDPDHAWATSWDDGLLEFQNRELINFYNQTNSSLQEADTGVWGANNGIVRSAGVDYDDDGNLWMTNSEVSEPIVVRTKDGSWYSFDPGNILNNNRLLSDVLVGQNGYKWIIRPRNNGLLVFNDNGTISNDADDEYQILNAQEGQGGLPAVDVLSIAEDQDGEIWVGTNKGIGVFYDPEAIFNSSDFDAQQILIEQDGNVQILLETEQVTAIAVDGAGRKWLGTAGSGIFLVSEDGTEQIHHFTVDNSPLPGNTISSVAVDDISGEVFIGTQYGILSYRSDATEGIFPSECATVFPNPVHEGYEGPIAITGLTKDSDVRITDAAGNVVYTTTSLGGQAIWPGTNMNGERVASGVYMAFAVDPFGAENCSTKILFIR